MANKKTNLLFSLMAQKLCRVTITDIQGGGRVVEVKASSLFEAVAQAVNSNAVVLRRTDSGRPIKVLVYEPKAEDEVKLEDFMAWLDRNSRSPRETINRMKIRELLGMR